MASNRSPERSGASAATGLEAEDRALLDRVAARIVALHLEVPAILTLESGKPLSVLAGQTLHFFEPLVAAMLRLPDYRRFARLIERREAIEELIRLLEARADETDRARRAARSAGARGKGRP
jgi:hypothetical protein